MLQNPIFTRSLHLDTKGTSVPFTTPLSSRSGKEQRQSKAGGKEMQHTGPAKPFNFRDLSKPRGMQKGVRVLPGARATISKETPEHKATGSKGTGRRGGISEDQLDHTARTPTKFLAEIELCNREKKNKKRNVNSSRGEGGNHNGTHNTGDCRKNNLFRSARKAVYTGRRSPHLQRRTVSGPRIPSKHQSSKGGT